jgi:hypothetical protein
VGVRGGLQHRLGRDRAIGLIEGIWLEGNHTNASEGRVHQSEGQAAFVSCRKV